MIATHSGHRDVAQLLIDRGADVNKADKDGWTPLYWACENGDTDVVEQLLGVPGIDVNKADWSGRTPLHMACEDGHTAVVEQLLEVLLADQQY